MSERTGKVQTVKGPVEPGQLGVTLMHEHVFCDLSARFKEPPEITKRIFAHKPLEVRDRWRVMVDLFSNVDNLVVSDIDDVVSELLISRRREARRSSIKRREALDAILRRFARSRV